MQLIKFGVSPSGPRDGAGAGAVIDLWSIGGWGCMEWDFWNKYIS